MGNTEHPARRRWLDALVAALPNGFVGRAHGEALNQVVSSSTVALNIPIADDVNMRFFELAASGTAQLARAPHNGEDTLFTNVFLVDDEREAIERLRLLLHDPAGLAQIAQRAAADAVRHDYEHRMQALLDALDALDVHRARRLGTPERPSRRLGAVA